MSTEAWIFVVAYVVTAWVLTGVVLALADREEVKHLDPVASILVAVLWLPVLVIFASMAITQAVVEWREARAGRDSTDTRAEGESR